MFLREIMKLMALWQHSHEPKKQLVDNYNKTCHLLDLEYDKNSYSFIGKCSLCGTKNFSINSRCRFCRAEIEY